MDQRVPEGTCTSQVLRSTSFDRASKYSMLKLIEIVILWVYCTIPFGLSLFRHFWVSHFNFLNYVVWLRITDEGSLPKMRIWSILLIKSDLKWCIYLSRSLCIFLNVIKPHIHMGHKQLWWIWIRRNYHTVKIDKSIWSGTIILLKVMKRELQTFRLEPLIPDWYCCRALYPP